MNRLSLVGCGVACCAAFLVIAARKAESGAADALVRLQQSTPGTQQIGHTNLSGKMMAGFFQGNGTLLTGLDAGNIVLGTLGNARTTGTALNNPNTLVLRNGSGSFAAEGIQATQFVGGGAGLTGVNADLLDGLNSTAFLQSIPIPLSLSGSSATHIIRADNSSSASGAAALYGYSTGAGSLNYGVYAESNSGTAVYGRSYNGIYAIYGHNESTNGIAVSGFASRTTGSGRGGDFITYAPTGIGVSGVANSNTGVNYGGYFRSESTNGIGVFGETWAITGPAYGVYGKSVSPDGRGVYGKATATSGTNYGVYGENASTNGSGVYGIGVNTGISGSATGSSGIGVLGTGNNNGGYFESLGGDGAGVFGIASSSGAGPLYGVQGQSNGSAGKGVYGIASNTTGVNYGVYGESPSTNGVGVSGRATSSTGTNTGVKGTTDGSSGIGVSGAALSTSGFNFGGSFYSNSTNGAGLRGTALATSGNTRGGLFECTSPDGYGVFGHGMATSGEAVGGYFQTDSPAGRGLFAIAISSTGVNVGGRFESASTSGRGVFGYATATSGTTYGVRGQSDSPAGYGVYAVGDLGASGVKSFRIDHPFDPENKYLIHYASESPFPQNFYSGNITTDAKGYAWVQLPDYFDEINADYKYQLTVIGKEFAQAIVSEEIVADRFQIRTSAPNVKVSWRVEANRNDRYVQRKKPRDVVEKEGVERGTYQHPELYGISASRGTNHDPERSTTAKNSR